MKIRFLSLICAASVLGTTTLLLPISGSAEEDGTVTTVVQMERSKALAYEPENEITGEIALIVDEHPIHVNITMYSSEKPVVYYDADLTAEAGSDLTKYVFQVDYSEYPDQSQLSQFQNLYTSEYFTGTYSSCYYITISAPDTKEAVFEESVLVADPHSDASVTGKTRYTYTILFDEKLEIPVTSGDSYGDITDGNADIFRDITMLWKPYALGDVDESGVIDMQDAYLILLYGSYASMNIEPDFEINLDASDTDGDGKITQTDAFLTLVYTSYVAMGSELTFEEFLASDLRP